MAVASFAIIGLAGCAPYGTGAQTSSGPAAATNQSACTAIGLAASGDWSGAQTHFLSAQEQSSDMGAQAAFLVLNIDSGALAIDSVLSSSPTTTTTDLATYNTDLASNSAYTSGG